ncbi:LOW QUALITY PROTEIN: SERTA domain-containing protein 2-like [Leucoraja erinacea]|uniref:LOW QUALITY PROTEIN: SERTA domain-containing protein 2-like n=1 Tax=Leucoraja erinaceus TaxID=7782 RepID=UPI0024550DA2|nr:LOW QUALITY PROTEIN: SERTA domain-containing protein 2-like [Leucoraja erinacea]
MLGRGAKRKFSENDAGLEGKGCCGPGPSRVSYTLQRQAIFNISLMKLYNQQPLTEPSLQKTVLINNMLRSIQEELKQEGTLRPVFITPSQPTDTLNDNYREAQLPPLPLASSSSSSSSPPASSCLTPASLLEADPFPAPLTPPATGKAPAPTPKDSFSSALAEIEELCPAPVVDGVRGVSADPGELSGQREVEIQENKPSEAKSAEPAAGSLEIPNTGFLTDLTLDDILFADIDTSMYDFDPCTAATAPSPRVTAVTTDEILKTLSPYSGQSVAPSQPFKMDLAELDHIMEVLVGS